MFKITSSNRGEILAGIILVVVGLALITSGAYYYFQRQIPKTAETVEEAMNDVRKGVEQLGSWLTPDPLKVRQQVVTEEELREDDLKVDQIEFQVRHDLMLVGSPDSVSEQIERLRSEINCQHFALYLNFPGLSFEKTMRSLSLFAERIIPRFQ